MAIQVQRRRGTTAENDLFTGAAGEITVDTDRDEPRVHDAARAGGFAVPNFSSLQKRLYSYDAAPGGTATAITCSTAMDAIAYTAGLEVTLKMASAATGASTLQWGSLAVKNIKKYSGGVKVDIEADDWATSQEITFFYDGTDFIAQLGGGSDGIQVIETIEITSSVSSAEFVGTFSANNAYLIVLDEIVEDGDNNAVPLRIEFSTNGTTWVQQQTISNINDTRHAGQIWINNVADARETSWFSSIFSYQAGVTGYNQTAGYIANATVYTSFRFILGGSNIERANISVIEIPTI